MEVFLSDEDENRRPNTPPNIFSISNQDAGVNEKMAIMPGIYVFYKMELCNLYNNPS
jgi:hypothetical protein